MATVLGFSLRAFATLIALVALTATLFAQFDSSTVLGTVRDANGAVIPNATVTLKNVATGIAVTVASNENGDYEFFNVKIGEYTVTAEAQGFKSAVTQKFQLVVNTRQRVDIALEVGDTSEVIEVTGAAALLETDTSARGQVITRRQIVNLPLNGRSYAALALLAPGVRESQSANQGDIAFRRESAFNVNGLRSTFNNFILDGIDNNFYGTTNQGFSNQAIQPSPDSVAEFKLTTNTYSAEYGRSAGAVINVSFRSGTNQFRGTVYNFLRNTALNATGFFRPPDGVKPQVNRNQFGFVFGGPIIKDRTFFFVDYEGSRWIQSPFQLASLPTMTQRQGILPVDVRVPIDYVSASGQLVRAGTLFPAGTPIPLTNFAQRVLSALPAPNRPSPISAGNPFGIVNNFGGFARNRIFEDKYDLRLDHKATDRLNFFGRLSQRKQTIRQPGLITGFAGGNAIGLLGTYNQQGVFGSNIVLPNTSVLEVRFAVTRLGMDRLPAQVGGPSMRELFGITGLPEGPRIQGGITPQDLVGFGRIGRQATNPQAQFPTTYNLRVNYAWTLGRHSLKTGYEYVRLHQDVDDTNPLYGLDVYGGGFSRPATTIANNPMFSLADFIFGARSNYQLATQRVARIRQFSHWAYLQDDFKVNSKLTLNLGVRYEVTSPFFDADNLLSNFVPDSATTGRIVFGSGVTIAGRALRKMDYNNFAPRIGFAYRPLEKVVVRGGYGVNFNYWNRMAGAELLSTNSPFVGRSSIINPAPTLGLCVGDNFTGCFRSREQGYPINLPNNTVLHIPRDMPWGYVQNWQLSVQWEIFKDTLLDVAYVGNKGVKLQQLADLNQARPLTPAEFALPAAQRPSLLARRPYQGFDTISSVLPTGFSNYHALQVKFEHRGRNLTLLNSFTWSKAIDNAGQVLEVSNGDASSPQNLYNIRGDKGPSGFDQRINNTFSAVYQLPFGRGQRFGASLPAVADAFLGGWALNAIVTTTTGQPINLFYLDTGNFVSANLADFLGGVRLRPNVIGDPLAPSGQRTFLNYFNRANILGPQDFARDPRAPNPTAPFGNIGRNALRGFAFYQTDLGVQKNFALPFINEASRLEFRAEFFNLFNRTNFNAPISDIQSANFGRVVSTFDPRTIQFALKLHF